MGSNTQVLSEESLKDLKESFERWSGFSFESENLEDALQEINGMKYKLECEISDFARGLDKIAKRAFIEE